MTTHVRAKRINDPEQAFWAKIEFEQNSGCWLWSAAIGTSWGYGYFRFNGRAKLAHRHSWELHRGPIPEGDILCHRCDTPACVNPDHLFLGSQLDNMRDMHAKGRGAVGERHGNAKFTAAGVAEVRRRYAVGDVTQKAIAIEYGVTRGAVAAIVRGENWRDAAA